MAAGASGAVSAPRVGNTADVPVTESIWRPKGEFSLVSSLFSLKGRKYFSHLLNHPGEGLRSSMGWALSRNFWVLILPPMLPIGPILSSGPEGNNLLQVLSYSSYRINVLLIPSMSCLPATPTTCSSPGSCLVIGKGGQQGHKFQQSPSQKPPVPSNKWKDSSLQSVCFKEYNEEYEDTFKGNPKLSFIQKTPKWPLNGGHCPRRRHTSLTPKEFPWKGVTLIYMLEYWC